MCCSLYILVGSTIRIELAGMGTGLAWFLSATEEEKGKPPKLAEDDTTSKDGFTMVAQRNGSLASPFGIRPGFLLL